MEEEYFEVKLNKQNEEQNNIKIIGETINNEKENIEDYFVVSITPQNDKNKNIFGGNKKINKKEKDFEFKENKKKEKNNNKKNKDEKNKDEKEDEYEEYEEERNKGLSENTLKQYIQNLRLYCYNLDLFEPYKTFIKLHHKISERKKCIISKETIKSCLNAIIWILKETYEEDKIKNIINEYKELVKHLRLSCIYDTYNQNRNNSKVPYWEIILKRKDR